MKLFPKAGAHRRRRAAKRASLPPLASEKPTSRWSSLARRLASLPSAPIGRGRPRRPRTLLPGTLLRDPKAALGRLSMPGSASARHRAPRERSVERRRARALVLGAMVFAAIVLLTALPWTTLLNQHAQLTSASTEAGQLQAENQELAAQARALSNRTTQAGLARQDYGLVKPGQKAYDILPASGTTASKAVEAGHVPLDEPPVVPGSRRSEELLGVGVISAPTANRSTTDSAGPKAPAAGAKTAGSGATDSLGARGFWSRVGHSLEFWN